LIKEDICFTSSSVCRPSNPTHGEKQRVVDRKSKPQNTGAMDEISKYTGQRGRQKKVQGRINKLKNQMSWAQGLCL
jgi:hypothetical protein